MFNARKYSIELFQSNPSRLVLIVQTKYVLKVLYELVIVLIFISHDFSVVFVIDSFLRERKFIIVVLMIMEIWRLQITFSSRRRVEYVH
jgi:hypothetical protein